MPTPPPDDLTLRSSRGGYNDTDPVTLLQPDECTQADNVEFFLSAIGERRQGTASLDLTSSGLTALNEIAHLSQWFPTNDPTLPEYWGMAVTDGVTSALARRDTGGTWHVITAKDGITPTAAEMRQIRSQALDGLLFIPYHSGSIDRTYVWPNTGTATRRAGLPAPLAAPAGTLGGTGLYTGTRYYRTRYIEIASGVVVRRSEPSPVTKNVVAGTFANFVCNSPVAANEGETHWEFEASLDNANWYRMAQTAMGATFTDTVTSGKLYPAVIHAAPTSTDGTAVTYVLLSNAAAQLNLAGLVSNGVYGNPATTIAGRGWIGYDAAGVYIPNTGTAFVWNYQQNWYASPDVAEALEQQATGGATGDYAALGTLSEAVGAYLLLPAAKYAIAVDGRLVYGGHWFDAARQSTVGWTPKKTDPGVGNAERAPIVTTGGTNIVTTADLNNYDGGPITGLAPATLGTWYAFKRQRIFSAVATRDVTNAYDIQCVNSRRGALPNSVVTANNADGGSTTFFLDENVGPCMLGDGGVVIAIRGLRKTWKRVNTKASGLICCGVYYPYKQQVIWFLSVDGGNTPTLGIKLQTSELRRFPDGTVGRGWSMITGRQAQALCAAALTTTVGNQTTDVPFIGQTTPEFVQQTDTGTDDNGTAYTATLTTAPMAPVPVLDKWGVRSGTLVADADSGGGSIIIKLIRDFGLETKTEAAKSLAPAGSETQVVLPYDDLALSELHYVQVQLTDGVAGKNWHVQRVDLTPRLETTS